MGMGVFFDLADREQAFAHSNAKRPLIPTDGGQDSN
jgi:hypothetical protein